MRAFLSVGNAPGMPTGYGSQGLLLAQACLAAGWDVTILAWNLMPANPTEVHQVLSTEHILKTRPALKANLSWAEPLGKRVTWMVNWYAKYPVPVIKQDFNRALATADASFLIVLQDIFMFTKGAFVVPAIVWMPLHFIPVEHKTVLALSDFDVHIGISGYGHDLLKLLFGAQHGLQQMKHIEYIPHGRDAAVFRPLDWKGEGNASALRASLAGWPTASDVHITLMVMSNSEESGRKAFDANLQAWCRFAQERDRKGVPFDHTFLVIHAEVVRAYDLGRLLETFGEYPERSSNVVKDDRALTKAPAAAGGHSMPLRLPRVLISPGSSQSATDDIMANMYRACNVLLATTCSEGCGVPILEAQLSGCPAITNATTAMTEETLFGESLPPVQYIARMDFNSGWLLPDMKAIVKALHRNAAMSLEERSRLGALAAEKARARYSNEVVVASWVNLLERLKRDVLGGRGSPCFAAQGRESPCATPHAQGAQAPFTSLQEALAYKPRIVVSEARKQGLAIGKKFCSTFKEIQAAASEYSSALAIMSSTEKTIQSVEEVLKGMEA